MDKIGMFLKSESGVAFFPIPRWFIGRHNVVEGMAWLAWNTNRLFVVKHVVKKHTARRRVAKPCFKVVLACLGH